MKTVVIHRIGPFYLNTNESSYQVLETEFFRDELWNECDRCDSTKWPPQSTIVTLGLIITYSFNVQIRKQEGIYKTQCNTKHIFFQNACWVISCKSSVLCVLRNLFIKNKLHNSPHSLYQCHRVIPPHAISDVQLPLNSRTLYTSLQYQNMMDSSTS